MVPRPQPARLRYPDQRRALAACAAQHAPHQRRFQTYLECDLAKLLEEWCRTSSITVRDTLLDEFLQFYLFFGPAGHTATEELKPLIQRALWGSSEYRVGVGEGLKERAFEALRLCIEGFLRHRPNGLLSAADLERCRSESFILLYRLLFIMFAEDRRLLPYRMNRNYTDNRSLGRYRDDISQPTGGASRPVWSQTSRATQRPFGKTSNRCSILWTRAIGATT